MILIIAEKPSVAGEIAKVVGATTRGKGYLSGNDYIVAHTIISMKLPCAASGQIGLSGSILPGSTQRCITKR